MNLSQRRPAERGKRTSKRRGETDRVPTASATSEGIPQPGSSQEAFGERLRRLREEVGLPISGLARQAGVTRQAIWKWETGHARPIFDSLQFLANALHVSVGELVDGSDLVEAYAIDGYFIGASPALDWLPISSFSRRQSSTKNVVLWADGPCCGFFNEETQQWYRCGSKTGDEPIHPTHWQPFPRGPLGC